MKRYLLRTTIGILAAVSVASLGVPAAWAAPTATTVVLTGGKSAVFGLGSTTLLATTSVAGSVSFTAAGAAIPGCTAVATTTASPFTATCAWTPSAGGPVDLSAAFAPTDTATYATSASAIVSVNVGVPVQGKAPATVFIYADTINTTSDKGVFAPKFGIGCSITSEFIVGQTIVFRVFGNSSDLGGVPLTPANVASATVTVSGLDAPLPLNYGNHSGAAFWTAVLKTGTGPGQYGTLGVINYKITMVTNAVPAVTKDVQVTKLVPVLKNGKKVLKNGKPVMRSVVSTKTVIVTPAVQGATGVFQPAFTPLSQLTLNAVPTV